MPVDLRSSIPIALSVVAIIASAVTIYLEFFRSISLDIAVSRHAYVSNTKGGLPDIHLSIAFRADGPEAKSITIDSARVTLIKSNTSERHELISSSDSSSNEKSFPLILEGGDVVTQRTLFSVDYNITELLNQYDTWCDKLVNVFPDQSELVNSIRNDLKSRFLPTSVDDTEEDDSESTSDDSIMVILANEMTGMSDVDQHVASLLSSASVQEIQNLLFFVSGSYEMKIEVLDPFGSILAPHQRSFTIDEVVSKILRHNLMLIPAFILRKILNSSHSSHKMGFCESSQIIVSRVTKWRPQDIQLDLGRAHHFADQNGRFNGAAGK